MCQIGENGQKTIPVILHDGLAPNAKYLGLLEDLLSEKPDTIISVVSTQPLAILTLRLSKDLRFLYHNPPLP